MAIAFPDNRLPIAFDARLREWNYGDLNGHRSSEVHGQRHAHLNEPYPGGESLNDVVARVRRFLSDLRAPNAERVLLVGHSATRYALEHLLESRPLPEVISSAPTWQPGWTYRLK